MTLVELIGLMDAAGLVTDAELLCDAFWLANRGVALNVQPWVPAEVAVPAVHTTREDVAGGDFGKPSNRDNQQGGTAVQQGMLADGNNTGQARSDATLPVYPRFSVADSERSVRASPIAIPAGKAIKGVLSLMRALRPLGQRWPSRQYSELDEDGTVQLTAQSGNWGAIIHPVFKPRMERWFDVELVLEDDDAIMVWAETLRDLSQLMRDTGDFRAVRRWRLRLSGTCATAAGAQLESTTGALVPLTQFGGSGVRRLVIFATNGNSEHWSDGSYTRVFAPWGRDCSVVLLVMTSPERWAHLRLGEVHGLCSATQPGQVAAALRYRPFWWSLQAREVGQPLMALPAVPLEAGPIAEWAYMQMARGRESPVFMLPVPRPFSREADDLPLPALQMNMDRAVAHLHQVSDRAFQLAVWLSPTAFTIPVARLVCATQFGDATDQRPIADLLQSGLVSALDNDNAPDTPLRYVFKPAAREILMRSLRDVDARQVARDLRLRISQYIEQTVIRVSGALTSIQMVIDPAGNERLPDWAQPFADVATTLFGKHTESPAGRLDGVRLLWVDNRPKNNIVEIEQLRQWGATITETLSTTEGMAALRSQPFDVIVTDMARGKGVKQRAGLDLLARVLQYAPDIPVIIFAGAFAKRAPEVGLKAGAFGVTNNRAKLYQLVEAAVQVSVQRKIPWQVRVKNAAATLALPSAASLDVASEAAELARQLVLSTTDAQIRFERILYVVQSCANSHVNQIILQVNGRLQVSARLLWPGTVSDYDMVSQDGLIGRCVALKKLVWMENTSSSADYLPVEPATRSELVLPISDMRQANVITAVINIEMPKVAGVDAAQIAWMQAFLAPLAAVLPTVSQKIWLCYAPHDSDTARWLHKELLGRKVLADLFEVQEQAHVSDTMLMLSTSKDRYRPAALDGLFAFSNIVHVRVSAQHSLDPDNGVIEIWPDHPEGIKHLLDTLEVHRYPTSTPTHSDRGTIGLSCLAYHPKGHMILTGDQSGRLGVWLGGNDLSLDKTVQTHAGQIDAIAFSSDGNWIVSGGRDRDLQLRRSGTLDLVRHLGTDHENWIMSVAFRPDGSQIASAGLDNLIHLWSPHDVQQKPMILSGHGDSIYGICYVADSQYLVSCGEDRTIRIWDTTTGKNLAVLEGHDAAVTAVAVSLDGSLIVSGGLDGTLRLWSRNGKMVQVMHQPGAQRWWSVDFSPDGRYIAAGAWEKIVQIWGGDTGLPLTAPRMMDAPVTGVKFSPDGCYLAASLLDGTVKILAVPGHELDDQDFLSRKE